MLLSILLAYVAYNIRTLDLLNRDMKLVEQQQLRRLGASTLQTNSLPKLAPQPPRQQTNSVSQTPKR